MKGFGSEVEIMASLSGKVAVVTGGNSGIGLATAKRFREEGARVAISGRDQKTLDEAVKTIGGDVIAVRADVSKLADLDKFYKIVGEKFGKIDVLFANAGVAKFAPFADSTESMFDETFDINVKGVFFSIQKALPLLNDGASIIINSSVVNETGLADGLCLCGDESGGTFVRANPDHGIRGSRDPGKRCELRDRSLRRSLGGRGCHRQRWTTLLAKPLRKSR